MDQTELIFCENGECKVVLFLGLPDTDHEEGEQNCPSCGRFGRIKNTA